MKLSNRFDLSDYKISHAHDLKIGDTLILGPDQIAEIKRLYFYDDYVNIELQDSVSKIDFCLSKNMSRKLRIIPKL